MCYRAVNVWLWKRSTPIREPRITVVVGGCLIVGSAAAASAHTPHATDRQAGWGCGVQGEAGLFEVESVFLCVLARRGCFKSTNFTPHLFWTETPNCGPLSPFFTPACPPTKPTCCSCSYSHCVCFSNMLAVFASDIKILKQTPRKTVRTTGTRMAHFLPLLPNESHKEREASIFQCSRQAGSNTSLWWGSPEVFCFFFLAGTSITCEFRKPECWQTLCLRCGRWQALISLSDLAK